MALHNNYGGVTRMKSKMAISIFYFVSVVIQLIWCALAAYLSYVTINPHWSILLFLKYSPRRHLTHIGQFTIEAWWIPGEGTWCIFYGILIYVTIDYGTINLKTARLLYYCWRKCSPAGFPIVLNLVLETKKNSIERRNFILVEL